MNLNDALRPQAKMDNLVVQDLSDEILIYNLENNKAYSLNETTTLVWQNCDGTKDVRQIAKTLEAKLNQNIPDELVWLALDSLKKEKLISFDDDSSSPLKGLNRRDVIKRVGLATMAALPIIVAVSAPTAANAQSVSCSDCVVGIGEGVTVVCPMNCGGLTCTCYGNNSCMGVGQTASTTADCNSCTSVPVNPEDPNSQVSTMNNSFRCV